MAEAAVVEAATSAEPETAPRRFGAQSMIAPLRWVLVHAPDAEYTAEQWRGYGLEGEPDLAKAREQHAGFVEVLARHGASVEYLNEHTSIQTTATFDPVLITDRGAVLLQSGRRERRVEMFPMARKLAELEIPVIGWLRGEGFMDAGDTTWLDHDTLLIGMSYRTNEEGIRQLRRCLEEVVSDIRVFDMPHYRGPAHVLHLMSVLSLVAQDVAVVFPPLMPVRLLRLLQEREFRLVEVPEEEFATEACNVLCTAPGRAVMVAGNPLTQARLEAAGIEVTTFEGDEICVRRISGPTCNTRPLLRA
jgi:dimethylargininase